MWVRSRALGSTSFRFSSQPQAADHCSGGPHAGRAQRSEIATCSKRSIPSCMPPSIPVLMIASRSPWLPTCMRG